MKHNGTKHTFNDPLDRVLASIESAARSSKRPQKQRDVAATTPGDYALRDGIAPDSSSPFAHIDAIAASSLSSESLARYEAYKEVLLIREQDEQSAISTLSIFVWDLFEGRSVHAIN